MADEHERVKRLLAEVPRRVRGPGGAVAIVKDGKVVGHNVWGYANLDSRIGMTANTLLPICSISKQMVCMLIAELARSTTPDIWKQLSQRLVEVLGDDTLKKSGLRVEYLCHMQSGLRDYWAMTDVWGAKPETVFSIPRDGPPVIQTNRTFHFEPGTEFSYNNYNFFLLGRMVEAVCGESLESLLSRFVFSRANMKTAALCPNTAKHPLPIIGYEGTEQTGYIPAINNIEWSGDAGVVASLNDMIAYEQYLEQSWTDETSAYRMIAAPPTYKDGKPALYGFGLVRKTVHGFDVMGHSGGLRGFRSNRLHVPAKHLSIVVLLNHEGDLAGVCEHLLNEMLGQPVKAEVGDSSTEHSADWPGVYLEQHTNLAITIEKHEKPGMLKLKYSGRPESIKLVSPVCAKNDGNVATIEKDTLRVERLGDNRILQATRVEPVQELDQIGDLAGEYDCPDSRSIFRCFGRDGLFYGCFEGFLGQGHMRLMRNVGKNIWLLSSPRGMDAPAPGDWTLVFKRDESGRVLGVNIGCWLARNVQYSKVS